MATLYLKEQGTQLRIDHERLVVARGQEHVLEVPAIKISRVVVMGRGVQVSTAALIFLAQHGIALVYTNEGGTFIYAAVNTGLANNGLLRLQQARLIDSPPRALALVQAVVQGKLANQEALLRREAPRWGPTGVPAVATIARAREAAGRDLDADSVRGHEGAGAAAYWRAWRAAFETSWGFAGREYHPPRDPLNALLSFGYTLLLHELVVNVQKIGLDPFLGFFHVVSFGRPSLALDLEEEFRPLIVDPLVLALLDASAVQRADFAPPAEAPDALYLTGAGREQVIAAYEARLQQRVLYPPTHTQETWRRCLSLQVEHLARVIAGEQPAYQPMPAPPPTP